MDDETYVSAAEAGHLDILKWLYENGEPLRFYENADISSLAEENGYSDIVKWMSANNLV
jgi:hypothetical protein